ncbi:hypothetical protein KAR48_20570 [bacterium]|nr:hypothetical protein [bacterium]
MSDHQHHVVEGLHRLIEKQLLGIGFWVRAARMQGHRHPAIDQYVIDALISATQGVNSDPGRLITVVQMGEAVRQAITEIAGEFNEVIPEAVQFVLTDAIFQQVVNGATIQLFGQDTTKNRSTKLQHLSDCKTIAATAAQSAVLDYFDIDSFNWISDSLFQLAGLPHSNINTNDDAIKMAFQHLYTARSQRFGVPDEQAARVSPAMCPAIVVAGEDFQILEDVLIQSFQRGLSVATYGPLKAAHSHPAFHQFEHLSGHIDELLPDTTVVLSMNFPVQCLNHPREKLFTTGLLGMEGATHIADKGYKAIFSYVQ